MALGVVFCKVEWLLESFSQFNEFGKDVHTHCMRYNMLESDILLTCLHILVASECCKT